MHHSLDMPRHVGQRRQLIQVLRDKGISDERVLDAMMQVPRHIFLESSFEEFAYRDAAFPIRASQTISQPFTVAVQTQALALAAGAKVLEIGTGSGYQAAVLAAMGFRVHSIERQKELFEFSKRLLGELHAQVVQRFGDGYKGMPAFAPFDGILVTAAAPEIPPALLAQLAVGGRLILPVGPEGEDQRMWRITRQSDKDFEREDLGTFRFVPMLGNVQNR
jgi:protein-L-isoaspartate(D-aspartate) O-methyltransferase